MNFKGKISEIRNIRSGTSEKGKWASIEIEVTESSPQNADYPQIGLFDLFKNGEYVNFVDSFKDKHKIGDEVSVEFNLKRTTYQKKDGSGEGKFYKTSAWKIEKLAETAEELPPLETVSETASEKDDLPF